MYGTVAFMRLKPGAEDKLLQLGRDYENLRIPGYVMEHVYRLDAGNNVYVLVVGFESREAYVANANSPEQHARYLQYRELLEDEPEWHDGEFVYSYPTLRRGQDGSSAD
jgi:antibiotic biosynthesis monooxygenase (ABM) superfamily enzyme